MRAMGCHTVVGYSEQTSIRDELIILSAMGTAALVNLNCAGPPSSARHRQPSGAGQPPSAGGLTVKDRLFPSEDGAPLLRRLHVDVALANEVAGNDTPTVFTT